MHNWKRYLGQALLYALFFIPLAFLTSQPLYTHQADDMATLKIAVRHAGQIVGECVAVSGPQYDKLPKNMRPPEVCPRERSPLNLALYLDDRAMYSAIVPASGLHNDGVSSVYQRFSVPSGEYQLRLAMNDDAAVEGDTWSRQETISLQPAQVMVVSFKEGFTIK